MGSRPYDVAPLLLFIVTQLHMASARALYVEPGMLRPYFMYQHEFLGNFVRLTYETSTSG